MADSALGQQEILFSSVAMNISNSGCQWLSISMEMCPSIDDEDYKFVIEARALLLLLSGEN